MNESATKTERIEAHGVKGMKSTPWRKIFKNPDALMAWVEKHDAVVYATSTPEPETSWNDPTWRDGV